MSGKARYEMREWEAFWLRWHKLTEEFPKTKQTALRMAGVSVLKEVQSQIAQRVSDPQGRVKKWQEMTMGSGGGYVAVTASNKEIVQKTKAEEKTNSRAVTRYLEHGHAIRPPTGLNELYRTRLSRSLVAGKSRLVVPGLLFYSWAKMNAGDLGRDAAEKTLRKLKSDIERGGKIEITRGIT